MLSSGGLTGAPQSASGEVVREIDDPHTGARWLLMRSPEHPGGPGRLVLVAQVRNSGPNRGQAGAGLGPEPLVLLPVIRAGDRLIVEENTAVVDARLEAIALGTAAIGSALDVRLKIGGKVLRAVALAAGRAEFRPETEVRP
jgi:hypothetical protein